nr:unnamed protein product [Callosobruchus chinensis]
MSPDMNPIEHVWDYVSRAILNRNNPPRSTQELIVAATEEWRNIPQEVINNLIIGMHRRVDALIRSRSGNTKARKYFSPSNLLTLYKAQIRPSLEYCSHIWEAAAPTTLSIIDAVQRRAIRLIGDPALTCHLQPLSHRRAVSDLSLFYRYSNGFCSSELTSVIPPLSKPARCTRRTSSSHPKAVVLHTSYRMIRPHLCPQGVQGLEWTAW